jgi:uncharacterized protein YoxC
MDMISTAAAAVNLCFKIVEIIRATRNVDTTFNLLKTEVEELSKVLDLIKTCFSNPTLAAAALESQTGPEAELWRNMKQAVEDCRETLQGFQTVLESVYKEEGQLLRRPRMLVDLNFLQAPAIADFRQKIGCYRETLKISLQLITLYLPRYFCSSSNW